MTSNDSKQEEAATAVVAANGDDFIKSRIFTIRGVQVMLDRDLAALYGVETRVLNQAVKRNEERFDTIFKAMDGGDFPPQKVFFEGKHYDAYSFARKLVRKATRKCCQCENVASCQIHFPMKEAA